MVVTSCTTWWCSSGKNTEGMYVRPFSPRCSDRAIDWMTTIIIIIINRLIIMTPPVVPIFAWVQPGRIGSRPRCAAKTAGLRRPPDRRIGGSRIGSQERSELVGIIWTTVHACRRMMLFLCCTHTLYVSM
jgi:hypothetical protein